MCLPASDRAPLRSRGTLYSYLISPPSTYARYCFYLELVCIVSLQAQIPLCMTGTKRQKEKRLIYPVLVGHILYTPLWIFTHVHSTIGSCILSRSSCQCPDLQISSLCVAVFSIISRAYLFWTSILMDISFWAVVSWQGENQNLLTLLAADDATIVLWNLDTRELLQEILFGFHGPVTVACWIHAVCGSAKAFAFGCADGSIHMYALDHEGVSSVVCMTMPRQMCAYSPSTTPHLSEELMKDLSKMLRLNPCTGDSQMLGEALCRFGLWTKTVSYLSIVCHTIFTLSCTQILSRKPIHPLQRNHTLQGMCSFAITAKSCSFSFWKAMKCMYSGVFVFIDPDVATALPITLSHSGRSVLLRFQLGSTSC